MAYNWVPIIGEFRVEDDAVEFIGKLVGASSPEPGEAPGATAPAPARFPALGTILSDQCLANGAVSASVVFEEVGDRSACEIVLGYDVERRGFISAGITGDDVAAFAIREWQPGTPGSQVPSEMPGWVPFVLGGDRSFIKAGQRYTIQVNISGAQLALDIDGVRVGATSLRSPILVPRPVGIWCLSHAKVTIDAFVVSAVRPNAFVVMQFAKPFDDVYADVIRDTCLRVGLDAVRSDEIYGPGLIIRDIVDRILRSQVVIAEITPENANVYFEIGYALAWNKPIVLLARQGTELPFDVSGFRVLFYEDSIGGKARLQKGLEQHLRAIMGRI